MSSNDSSEVEEDGRKPDPEEVDEEQQAINAETKRRFQANLIILRKIKTARQDERAKSYWPGPEDVMDPFYYPFLEYIFSHMLHAYDSKAHLSSDNEPWQWQKLTTWAFQRSIGPLNSFRRWDVDDNSMYTKLKPSLMHAVKELAGQYNEVDLPSRLQTLANDIWNECQANKAAVDFVGELVGQDDNSTSMPAAADDMEIDNDNQIVGEEESDMCEYEINPIFRASAEVVNMAPEGSERYKLAYKYAIHQCGWVEEDLLDCLDSLEDWAAVIVDDEDSIEYKQFQSHDSNDKGKKSTHHANKKRVQKDIDRLIEAGRLGGVSVHTVCLEHPTKITITNLPYINDTNVDYLRSAILFELYGSKDIIAHIHDGLVNYYQDASHALTRNKFPFGYNAATSACNIFYSHGKLSVYVKRIFRAVHPNNFFEEGRVENLFGGHECRERIPSKKVIEERIGPERLSNRIYECGVQNINDYMECLRKNEGRHGVLPGLWLPVEAVITDEHLFKFFDRLNQEWQHKVENGENDGQDETEKDLFS
jgi:hypothetical protein